MSNIKPQRRNVKKNCADICIKGTKYKYEGNNKDDLIQWLKNIQDKYS